MDLIQDYVVRSTSFLQERLGFGLQLLAGDGLAKKRLDKSVIGDSDRVRFPELVDDCLHA